MRPARATLEALFENAPRFVERLATAEYEDWDAVLTRGEELARTLPDDEQLELIDGHPRIGALPSSVSATSYREQGYDRDTVTAELQARLDLLNTEYEARFGFRFVVFVNRRSRAELLPVLRERLSRTREQELETGIRELVAIARDRWQHG